MPRSSRVVVLAPALDEDAGFGQARELLDVEEFVADAGLEGLHERVLPRTARLDDTVRAALKRHQSRSACEVNSGPLSTRKNRGAPRAATSWSGWATVWSALIDRSACMTSDCRVCSSTTLTSRSGRPSLAEELSGFPESPDTIHYFHGTRVWDPVRFAAEGLRPLLAMLDAVWAELGALAPELPASDVHRLRDDLTAGVVGPHTYPLRVNGAIDHGPCGHLLRDALLHPDDYNAVDYLKGSEIPSDICEAVHERFGIDLGKRYRAATTPCIVEFAMPSTSVDEALASAAWYVEAALRGERSANAPWGYDGGGAPVPATAIVAVTCPQPDQNPLP